MNQCSKRSLKTLRSTILPVTRIASLSRRNYASVQEHERSSFGPKGNTKDESAASFVKIVECGVRDGLQNEPTIVDVQTKLDLLDRLANAGLIAIESGAMVSKKAVPQVLSRLRICISFGSDY
jgi:hypothetical protein